MNAILREEYEAPVLTIEAIEVHLSYLRPELEAVRASLPVLHDKIDQLSARMDAKIEQANKDRAAGDAALAEKIDQLSAKVGSKIDQLSAKFDSKLEKTDSKLEKTDSKIDKLTERVLEMQGSQNGLKWFLSSVAVIAAGTSIAHTFGWI